jgi:hypothetical protein
MCLCGIPEMSLLPLLGLSVIPCMHVLRKQRKLHQVLKKQSLKLLLTLYEKYRRLETRDYSKI